MDLLGPEVDAALAAALLGDVVVVEGWAAAWSLVHRHPGLRAVTPDGDLVTAFGVRAAQPDGAGPAALEAARVGLERARVEAARASSRHNAARRAAEDAAAREAGGRRPRLAAWRPGFPRPPAPWSGPSARRPKAPPNWLASTPGAPPWPRPGAPASSASPCCGPRSRPSRARRLPARPPGRPWPAGARMSPSGARAPGARAKRRRAWWRRRWSGAACSNGAWKRCTASSRTSPPTRWTPARWSGSGLSKSGPGAGLEAARRHLEVLRERQRVLREEAGVEGRDLAAAQERREALDAAVAADREQLSAVAIESAALRVRLEGVAEGLRRDVDASEEKALGAPRPDLADGVVPEEHLASLEAEIRRIGPVNPLAAAEYRELAERAAFLEGQLADLEGSRRELRKVISALDEEIARLFREACDDIGRRFEENVTVLFPGGRGRLLLTDPDDPLASGVDIHVQPMGKKISRLSMLSGGERSLAALAFLFAVFRARPSPFYVLDEVEAALDDTNLRRFIRLVGSLRDSSQLVIITHQQQTMEAADLLYGVTMEPGESSRVLAKRLDRAARPLGAEAGTVAS